MSASPEDNYRSAHSLALCVSILWTALVMTAAVSALVNAYQVQLLDAAAFGATIPPSLAETQDARQRWLAAIEVGIQLVAAIVFLAWIYRANRNARALGAEGMQYSPGWSVGWFLVPLMSLFMPYLVVKELWKASSPAPAGQWRQVKVSPTLGVWWTVCVVAAVLQYSPLAVLFNQRKLADISHFGTSWAEAIREFFWGRLVSDVVWIVLGVLTMVVVICITDLQGRKRYANEPRMNTN